MASSLECIAWMVVGLTESVTIIVLNSLTVIAFYRNRYLRKRSTYLVISLAVADMLSGVISPLDLFYYIGVTCNFWRHIAENWYQIPAVVTFWFLGCSLTNMTVISLERLNAKKVSLLGSYHRYLVDSTTLFMCVNNDSILYT